MKEAAWRAEQALAAEAVRRVEAAEEETAQEAPEAELRRSGRGPERCFQQQQAGKRRGAARFQHEAGKDESSAGRSSRAPLGPEGDGASRVEVGHEGNRRDCGAQGYE